MWMHAQVIDSAGTIVASAEGEITEDGDLTELVRSALDRFRQSHPGQSLMAEAGQGNFTIRFGEAGLANA